MLGAIIGDIAGSRFEFNNRKSKNFTIFHPNSFFTDDSVMTAAIGKALLETNLNDPDLDQKVIASMQEIGRHYPDSGYGGNFYSWVFDENPEPYNSFGNGAAMRISPAGWITDSLEEALELSDLITGVSHNHPEGLKGARAVTEAIWLARHHADKEEIKKAMQNYYPLKETLDEIRPGYYFNETSQNTVPQAIQAFLEAEDFEDAIRNAVSLGGDSDTLAAITGSIAQAYFGIDPEMKKKALEYLDDRLRNIVVEFEEKIVEKNMG